MSNFRKRNVQRPTPGTRISAQTGQLITSSGNPSLDVVLGGGLPIGSICLVEEDKHVTFSRVLAKYFLAEGVVSKHSVLLGTLDDDPKEFMLKLPKPLNEDEVEIEKQEEPEDKDCLTFDKEQNGLRIAWRYNDLPPVNSEQRPTKIGHHFNLMEPISAELLDYTDLIMWKGKHISPEDMDCDASSNIAEPDDKQAMDTDTNTSSSSESTSTASSNSPKEATLDLITNTVTTGGGDGNSIQENTTFDIENNKQTAGVKSEQPPLTPPPPPPIAQTKNSIFEDEKFMSLLQTLQSSAREPIFSLVPTVQQRSLLRICLTSLGSPLWYDENFVKDLVKFLTILRGTVRNCVSVCMITMPMHLVAKCDPTLVPIIRNLVDYAIELESFAGTERETHSAYKDYHGLVHLHKITAINTLNAYVPETRDLAFKLRRKKFVISKLHLPPELQEAEDEAKKPTISCGGASPAKATLDF